MKAVLYNKIKMMTAKYSVPKIQIDSYLANISISQFY